MGGICKNVYSDIYDCVNNKFFSKYKIVICWKFVIIYDLLDTTTYLVALMFLADIQRPSANVIRSLLMLVVNYIEVELDIIVIYLIIGKVFMIRYIR